ncbi:SRPBCC family protein [Terracoccus luteus]|uniref:Polyketide cyclase/dehydrase/lipid transport protein n=1 Tax=Terracoccus luteus TaxID=53356 RepID=A0A839PRB8_9MICO|nr:SRPBCC family protein [Terracoccus luteus]MBB2986047.1 hypothetical protein [Terracoccus luteus]MCP2171699.1 hypothetical protein [Terracoccus luteus]
MTSTRPLHPVGTNAPDAPDDPGGSGVRVQHDTSAAPEHVWSILADGWAYATWVVGASRMRRVDPTWPAQGSRLHHSFGLWPLVIDDTTTVLTSVEPAELTLQARGWPAGEATVWVTLIPRAGGTRITIVEDVTTGPGTLVPQPVRQLAIAPRNQEALRRLAWLAEGRGRRSVTGV